MKYSITYCEKDKRYIDKALDVYNEIKSVDKKYEIEMIPGRKGDFEVIYYEDPPALIFSRLLKGRLPRYQEIKKLLLKMT